MVRIEQRFNEIVYKKPIRGIYPRVKNLKSEDVVFFICDELNKEDFKEPFFNPSQLIFLGDGFKFLSYCGKEQKENISKNALVVKKKLQKGNKVIYRCYLMDKEGFNIRELFLKHSPKLTIKENNYSLSPSDYMDKIKEQYNKKEIVFVINKILKNLTEWSLNK